jgi:hypothetical protein
MAPAIDHPAAPIFMENSASNDCIQIDVFGSKPGSTIAYSDRFNHPEESVTPTLLQRVSTFVHNFLGMHHTHTSLALLPGASSYPMVEIRETGEDNLHPLLAPEKAALLVSPPISIVGIGWITTCYQSSAYLLLGQEGGEECPAAIKDTWSPCAGGFEEGKHRHIADTILAETLEESAGAYHFTLERLLSDQVIAYTYRSSTLKLSTGEPYSKSLAIFPVPIQEMKSREELKGLLEEQTVSDFKEKTDFCWLQLGDQLFDQLKSIKPDSPSYQNTEIEGVTIEGIKMTMLLRNAFVEDLIQPFLQNSLKKLVQLSDIGSTI